MGPGRGDHRDCHRDRVSCVPRADPFRNLKRGVVQVAAAAAGSESWEFRENPHSRPAAPTVSTSDLVVSSRMACPALAVVKHPPVLAVTSTLRLCRLLGQVECPGHRGTGGPGARSPSSSTLVTAVPARLSGRVARARRPPAPLLPSHWPSS